MTPFQRLQLRQLLPADPRGSRLDHLYGLVSQVLSEREMAEERPEYVDQVGVLWFLSIEQAIADAVWRHGCQKPCCALVLEDQWAVQTDLAGHWACGPAQGANTEGQDK